MKDYDILGRLLYEGCRLYPKKMDEINKKAFEYYDEYLKKENGKPKAVTMHTSKMIYPVIAFYKTMDIVCKDKESAYRIIDTFITDACKKGNIKVKRLLKLPGLYKVVPKAMYKRIHSTFGIKSGFEYKDIELSKTVCHIDMIKCPYNQCCCEEGYPELTRVFCDGDDIAYGNMHKCLSWERTKTLGRGNDVCDFIIRIKK